MGMKSLLFAVVFLLPILGGPTEVAGFLSFAAKTMTRFKMRLDARLRPDRDDNVVRNPVSSSKWFKCNLYFYPRCLKYKEGDA